MTPPQLSQTSLTLIIGYPPSVRLNLPHREPPPVMFGSHVDTVGTGGRYDGLYGVLAGSPPSTTIRFGAPLSAQ
jgi:acetylornithine deacetylase/succinyl-diaminopimelate desuccinylase-like protein